MLVCPEVIAVVSAADCGASEVAREDLPTVDVVVLGVVGMPPVAAISQTRICTRITPVPTNRQVDTAEHMKEAMLGGTVVAMGLVAMSQSPVNKSWFAT
jgi:hypothetical protein